MQRHARNYYNHFELAEQVHVNCEICGRKAIDLHHIIKRNKNQSKYDKIENIIALCRSCHEKAHANAITKSVLLYTHRQILANHKKKYEKQEYLKNI